MSGGIFISYRRDDARQAAGRLADDLTQVFGREKIFRDIEKIEIGVDFTLALEKALAECEVMLVLMGRYWLDVADEQGRRRLEQPEDWIRSEIVTALKRDVRVVPVLVDGATLPAATELPEDLRPLLRRQALELDDGRWRGDVTRLVDGLAKRPGLAPQPASQADPVHTASATQAGATTGASGFKQGRMLAGVLGVLVVGLAGLFIFSPPEVPAEAPAEQAADVVMSWSEPDLNWHMTFSTWNLTDSAIEIRATDTRDLVLFRGTALHSVDPETYTVALQAVSATENATCTLLVNTDDTEMTGTCHFADEDSPRDVRLTPAE